MWSTPSSMKQVTCSVPQGSVLRSLLFLLYTAILQTWQPSMVWRYVFADDTQVYIHCEFHNMAPSRDVLERCIQDIGHLMSANSLKLNPDKTELLWTGTRHNLSRLTDGEPRLVLGTEVIDTSACLHEVTFTPDLYLEKHASIVSGKCFFQLCQLRRVRCSLDSEAASTLIHSFVSNRVDYCNCLMAGARKQWTEKLQRVINAAACILKQMKKYDRGLTRILHDELHWLDMSERIQFKLCVHVYKCLHGIAPKYMMNLCRPLSAIEGRSYLRSAARGQLDVSRPKLSTYGKRAFTYTGSSAWNALPNYLKDSSSTLVMFKRSLKTFLFS